MLRSSPQPPSSEALTAPAQAQPTLKNRIDDAQADSREGVFHWLIFLLVGGVGLAHLLSYVRGVLAQWMLIKFYWH